MKKLNKDDISVEELAAERKLQIKNRLDERIHLLEQKKSFKRFLVYGVASIFIGFVFILPFTNRFTHQELISFRNETDSIVNLMLIDGTKILLDINSEVSYPKDYSLTNRRISFKGQLYLDVKRCEKHPFLIDMEQMDIQVKGTSFSVSESREEVKVMLESGRVDVRSKRSGEEVQLQPGKMLLFNKEKETVLLDEIDMKSAFVWKENNLSFKNEPLYKLVKTLSVFYNKQIEIESESIKQLLFSGEISREDSVESIMKLITFNSTIEYTVSGDRILLFSYK